TWQKAIIWGDILGHASSPPFTVESSQLSACPVFGEPLTFPSAMTARDPAVGFPAVDLRALVQHSESVPADATIQDVQKRFSKHSHDFMAVLDGERVLGICSREQVGTLLGGQFGFALYARQSVRDQLVPSPMIITENQPIESVLQEVFSR